MLRANRLLLAGLVMLAALPAYAADGGVEGKYKVVILSGANEVPLTVVSLEKKEGKLDGSVVTSGQIGAQSIKQPSLDGKVLQFDITGRTPSSFEGIVDGATILGSFKIGSNLYPAKLVQTTEEEVGPASQIKGFESPKVTELNKNFRDLLIKMRSEKDADKRSELQNKAMEIQGKIAAEMPGIYREVLQKNPNSPGALVAGIALLRNSELKASEEDARKWVEITLAAAAKHGPRMASDTNAQLAESLAKMPDFKGLALMQARKAETLLTDKSTDDERARVWKILSRSLKSNGKADEAKSFETKLAKLKLTQAKKAEAKLTEKSTDDERARVWKLLIPALKNNGMTEEAKGIEAKLAKVEAVLDKEYLAKVPPFKPEMFAGRKEKGDRKVVMELFTGAQCPPCVAADVAFDGLEKSYKPSELILLQYHLHIPGPDPMTNADTEARAKYYSINSTPSTRFNGKSPLQPGGGGMAQSEGLYGRYRKVINPILDESADTKLMVKAARVGDKIDIKADVSGVKDPGEKKRLRFVLVEETIRYVGGNKLRFHHHVVRDLPGGVKGLALNEANSQHSVTVNLDDLKKKLVKYLDNFAETRPFPYTERPLDFKHLKVVALVQDDETKEILQVTQVDVDGELTTKK
jgi:hypothetical protein